MLIHSSHGQAFAPPEELHYVRQMDEERIALAKARIEAAVRRIEAVASGPAIAGDPDLARKHEKLKSEASLALAELDRVIGSLEA